MNFATYLLLGVVGVGIFYVMFEQFMQTKIVNYKGHSRLVLFLTRDISEEGRKYGPRVFTMWNLSHILYFALGSYLFPDKRLLLWTLGLVWELLEDYQDAANPLDILWNTIGIMVGIALRKVWP